MIRAVVVFIKMFSFEAQQKETIYNPRVFHHGQLKVQATGQNKMCILPIIILSLRCFTVFLFSSDTFLFKPKNMWQCELNIVTLYSCIQFLSLNKYRIQGHTKQITYYLYEYKTQEYELEKQLDVGKQQKVSKRWIMCLVYLALRFSRSYYYIMLWTNYAQIFVTTTT